MASGGGQESEHEGALGRPQSNWAQEITSAREQASPDAESVQATPEDPGGLDVSSLGTMISASESQIAALEEAMKSLGGRTGGNELIGAFGRRVYDSVGRMLRTAQETSSAVADRIQTLSEGDGDEIVPSGMAERSASLTSRVERAYLAHRARCPPQELERRLSRQPSFPPVADPSLASYAAVARRGVVVAAAPIARTRTLEDLVRESDADDHHSRRTTVDADTDVDADADVDSDDEFDADTSVDADADVDVDSSPASFAAVLRRGLVVAAAPTLETDGDDHHTGTTTADADSNPDSDDYADAVAFVDVEQDAQRGGPKSTLPPPPPPPWRGQGCGGGGQLADASAAEVASMVRMVERAGGEEAFLRVHARGSYCGDTANFDTAGVRTEERDRGARSVSVNGADNEGGEPASTGRVTASAPNGGVRVYSFGRGDFGALLQPDVSNHAAEEGPVALKDQWSVLQVSTALFHTVAITASGDIIGCGLNNEGQLRPDLPQARFFPRPSLLEPVLSHRVTQVSCGLYHTACVTALGAAISWGGNEFGQLGHTPEATRVARPRSVQVMGAGSDWSSTRKASRVECGDLFTLILTSKAELLSCGVGECVGGDGTNRKQAELVQSLAGFPTVWMACGNNHSVVIGAGGEAMAFGLNTHGQLGVGPMAKGEGPSILLPRPVVGTFAKPLTTTMAGPAADSEDTSPPPSSTKATSSPGGGGTDGATTDGTTTNGAIIDGATTCGASTDGSSTDGDSTDGTSTDGATTDGATADAATTDGVAVNGATTDGAAIDGATTDGVATDAATTDGATTNGVVPKSAAAADGATIDDAAIDGVRGGVVTPVFLAARAACGQNHTVLVSSSGEAWACGHNHSGQLGLDPYELTETVSPVRVPLLLRSVSDGGGDMSGRSQTETGGVPGGGGGNEGVVQAAAGRAHTMLLLSDGRVVSFGSDEFGALGVSPEEIGGVEATSRSWHWTARELPALRGQWVASIAAGGEQSFAIVVASSPLLQLPTASATAMPPTVSAARDSEDGVKAAAAAAAAVGSFFKRGEARIAAAADWPETAAATVVKADVVVDNKPKIQRRLKKRQQACPEPWHPFFEIDPHDIYCYCSSGCSASASSPSSSACYCSADDDSDSAAAEAAVRRGAENGVSSRPGGGMSAAVATTTVPAARQGPRGIVVRSRFSVSPFVVMRSAGEFLELVRRARDAGAMKGEGQWGGSSAAGIAVDAVIEAIRQTFRSPSVLSGCFNILSPLGRSGHTRCPVVGVSGGSNAAVEPTLTRVDAEGLEAVYVELMGMGPRVVYELCSSIEEGIEVSAKSPSSSTMAAGVSFLLKYWQSPTIRMPRKLYKADPQRPGTCRSMALICDSVLKLRGHARWRLMRSAKEDYPPALFSSRLVRPLVAQLDARLKLDQGRGAIYPAAALLLKVLYSINELDPVPKIPYQDFFSDRIPLIPLVTLLADVQLCSKDTVEGKKKRFYMSDHAYLFPTTIKNRLLQREAALEKIKAAAVPTMQFIPGRGLVTLPFLLLRVNRERLLRETLSQVCHVPNERLRLRLKVAFVGEEGIDEGGVTKEFFQLLIVQLFDQSYGMFVPAGEDGRYLWFNKDCVWADEEYLLVGLLVGLAVYAGVILDVPLPLAVFRKVLGQQLSLRDLGDVDPDLLQGLQKLRDYDGGDDEDVFGVDFRVAWDDLGMKRTHDLKENGQNIPVTASNKEEYVELYAKFLLTDSVSRQFEQFQKGFLRVMGASNSISLLRAEELEVLATGIPELDFGELEKTTMYIGGYNANHPIVKAFWGAVGGMPLEEKRRLLMFVTGSKKAPLGGLGTLRFKIQRAGPDTDRLPTAHTCFNVLLLPEYGSAEKLTGLLKRAIVECEGFGLH